jgi:hypothetical protein
MTHAAHHASASDFPTSLTCQPDPGADTVRSTQRFRRAHQVQQAEYAGTVILFDGKTYFILPNGAARDLWALLAEPRSIEELAASLEELYDAPREVIARDVEAQLARLCEGRLVLQLNGQDVPAPVRRPWWQFRLRTR